MNSHSNERNSIRSVAYRRKIVTVVSSPFPTFEGNICSLYKNLNSANFIALHKNHFEFLLCF